MRAECVQAVTAAAQSMGMKNPPRIDDIENTIRQNLKQLAIKDRASFNAMPVADRLKMAGEMAVKEAVHKAVVKKVRADLQVIADSRRAQGYAAMDAKGIGAPDQIKHTYFFGADLKGGRAPLESLIHAQSSAYKSKLDQLWDLENDSSILGVIAQREGQEQFIKELYGIDSRNPKAKHAAQQFNKINDEMIDKFNRYGGDVDKRLDWRLPQILNPYRLLKMGEDAFVKAWMEFVDRSKYVNPDGSMMDDAAMARFLKESYNTMVKGGQNKEVGEGGSASIANRRQAHRQIHYKSPDAYMKAMDTAGGGNVWEQIHQHIEAVSRDITLVEQIGPNPDYAFRKDLQKAIDKAKVGKDYNEKAFNDQKTAWEMLTGQYDDRLSVRSKHYIAETKAAFVASRLGSMVISQLADLGTIAATARAMNVPMTHILANAAKYAADPDFRTTARSMGFAMESMATNFARFNDGATSYGSMSKMAGLVVQLQGATAWNNMWRGAFGTAMSHQISSLNTKFNDIASLSKHDRLVMESKGITDQDWGLWKLAQRDANGMATHKSIDEIQLQDVRQFIQADITRIQQESADLIAKLDARNQLETGWVQSRLQKYQDKKAQLDKILQDMEATRVKRADDLSDRNLRQAGTLQMRAEQAEVDFEIFQKSLEAQQGKRTDKFMDDVKRGLENYGRRRSEIGERLGAKRHSAKLAAYANDAQLEKLANALSEKFNKLYGPERTEDGFKVVGRVVKAAKELDAYTKKMEERIANATKKDGTPKKGKEGTIDRAERLGEEAKIEYQAIKQRADDALEELRQKTQGKEIELEGLRKAIDGRRERAEAEADIAAYLATEKSVDRIQAFTDTLEFRGNQVADRMGTEGERLGYRKGMMEARLREMNKAEERYAKTAQKEVSKKAAEFDKRIDKALASYTELKAEVDARMAERQAIVGDAANVIEKKIDEAALNFREQSSMKYLSMTLEETHMAVLNPSMMTKAEMANMSLSGFGSLLIQFKSFPWAYFKQHFLERSNMTAAQQSHIPYQVQLLGMSAIFGGAALMLNDIASGRDPREVATNSQKAEFAFAALMKGGGLGIFNDILEVAKSDYDAKDVSKLTGPAISTMVELTNIAGTGVKAAVKDGKEGEKAQAKLAKDLYGFGVSNTPFQNFWLTKAFVHNILLDDLQEWANPGHAKRTKQRAEKNYGAGIWMTPDQIRAPDLGNVAGNQ